MADGLDKRLLATINKTLTLDGWEDDIDTWRVALRAVVELHAPRQHDFSEALQCVHCADQCHSGSGLGCDSPDAPYPCDTIQVIARALDVEENTDA